MTEKTQAELLREQLCRRQQHACEVLTAEEIAEADEFCEGYKQYLDLCKTERACTNWTIARAEKLGFTEFVPSKKYEPGAKIYLNQRNKAVVLVVLGKRSLEDGLRMAAAHIDSPRLDLKQNPLYEDKGLALFKTHYYGGVRKYQWVTIPLALHGVVAKKDGSVVEICIGEKDDDPRFCITDLLPHLASEQSERKLKEGIKGEELNIVVGSRPLMLDGKAEGFKLAILKHLYDNYGMVEEDLISAEFEAVPAIKACDIGFDRALIGAYGHDDRVCSYPCTEAIFALDNPDYTAVTVLADKEEIGSVGNTGLDSNFLCDFLHDLAHAQGANPRTMLRNSKCLSADVDAGFDPTWPNVMDPLNSAYMSQGLVLTKYTGSRGKSGASDANAEYIGWLRRVLDDANILWQAGLLGKVDEGGGGTLAMFLAKLNLEVVDLGVPLLSMHAPFELAAKTDIAMMFWACDAFFKAQ